MALIAGMFCFQSFFVGDETMTKEDGMYVVNTTTIGKDIEGYKKAMSWKLLAFAISALLAGGVGLYSDYVKPINTYVYLALTAIFLVILILYARAA